MFSSHDEISRKSLENESYISQSNNNRQKYLNINKDNNNVQRKNNLYKSENCNQKTNFVIEHDNINFHHISINVRYNENDNNTAKNLMHLNNKNLKILKPNNESIISSKNISKSQSEVQNSDDISDSQNESEIESRSERQNVSKNESRNESINSSSKNSSQFIQFIKNPFILYNNIRNSISSIRSRKKNSNNESINTSKNYDEQCLICEEPLKKEEIDNNILECFHFFCDDCYFEYLKEKVNNNQIKKIKCLYKDCDTILYDNFIVRKLCRDMDLCDKYKKLQKRSQLLLDPKVQLCPFPDCESYAKKEDDNNFVTCIENKHQFCFNCLKGWHKNKKCDDKVDKSFENWRNSFKVKRCPKCKFFIEKNEGCNHITCSNCGYQFCWLCLSKYDGEHFSIGRCSGLQYADCTFCSSRIINFFYQFLFVILKGAAFAICLPFAIVFFIYYQFFHKCINIYDDCPLIFYGIAGTLSCLNFIMCGLTITSFIFVLMIFIWPLQDKVFSIVFDFF